MENYFKLTSESMVNVFGVTLFRIELTVDCKWGKAGDKGGWIESENLKNGNARVYGDAWVSGNAQVSGDAQVYGDARLWPGGNSVICHPPCRAWGQLSHFAKPRPDEKELAIYSINTIRKWGGVLEHPRASKLWPHMGLPTGLNVDEFGGYSILINQSWFGHKAQKKTLLYICGVDRMKLPPVPIRFDRIDFTVTSSKRKSSGQKPKARLEKKEREATPIELALWLIEVAKLCNKKN